MTKIQRFTFTREFVMQQVYMCNILKKNVLMSKVKKYNYYMPAGSKTN